MKLSEVIAELEKIKAIHGDIPMVVRRYDQGRGGWEPVGDIATGYHYFIHDDGGSYQDFSAALTT